MNIDRTIDIAKRETKCHGCSDIIVPRCVRIGLKTETQKYFDYYHVPCSHQENIHTIDRFHMIPSVIKSQIRDNGFNVPKALIDPTAVPLQQPMGSEHPCTFNTATQHGSCESATCDEYILKGCVFIRRTVQGLSYSRHPWYHIPCFLAEKLKPPGVCLSDIHGFRKLSPTLQEEVRSVHSTAPKDIRDKIPLSLPMTPPKRCLAKTVDGQRCRFTTEFPHPKADPLLDEGCYVCDVHRGVELDDDDVKTYEEERKHTFAGMRRKYGERERIAKRARRNG